jgi:Eukaryotic translation initiation factor 3 subunit 7 (eIF-3)
VSETAREPPQATEDIDEINHPEKLSIEATMINQNFSQQVLKENDPASRKTVSLGATNKISAGLSSITHVTTNPSSLISLHNRLLQTVRAQSFLRGRQLWW